MDPLTLAAGAGALAAAAGFGTSLRLRQRLRRAEADLSSLRHELAAERHAANHDPLTGLPNRRAFQLRGNALITAPDRPVLACAVVDLNSFKQINDTLGHAAGDQVLVTIAGRLTYYAGDDLVARLGGDEFAGLFTGTGRRWRAPAADQLAELLAAPMVIGGRWLRVTAAVGVAPVHPGSDLCTVLHHADHAMYQAKVTGRGGRRDSRPAVDRRPATPAVDRGGHATHLTEEAAHPAESGRPDPHPHPRPEAHPQHQPGAASHTRAASQTGSASQPGVSHQLIDAAPR